MEDIYLTPAELSDRLDISSARLKEMRLEADGPAYALIDGEILYRIDAVIFFELENMFMREATRTIDLGPWRECAQSRRTRKKETNIRKRSAEPFRVKHRSH
ncbi:hypothetical protein LCGC14_1250810 [marine sediment metagenome]|uniref:Helix-turn-helix domain-containing protein n=1 Tax=marine sediment metagenome TaxID=412755 RepID=A0A0F9LPU9_9ZZZZ|tara:strand:+ start:874 stop:1179 length:306 start_codon:yes stop_codon:yes gene_type:complete